MAHMPKRAAQHGVFQSGAEAPISALKPGQEELHRKHFYTTEAKPLQETYLAQDSFKDSIYRKSLSKLTLPEDYLEVTQPIKVPPPGPGGYEGTDHWISEYKHVFAEGTGAKKRAKRQYGAPYQMQDPPGCVSQPMQLSFYQNEFGTYGSNPRSKLGSGKMKSDLTVGTTKGTSHIPGYQGFLPSNTNNPKVAAIESGVSLRSVDKSNITEIFHLNLPGYAGHLPSNACNDRGPRQMTTMTVMGRAFSESTGHELSMPHTAR
eukprot:gnl/MRDRNA2_/MRDRNA2_29103_c0_seq1.p1 gnl/MRDRNA2_/MRDRNA2_29103_c0~~gnl/MRDRNA2_/MRDRNA2_29103_c0_seq1.p1  ORF type:complete len:297 (-),score=50.78 gnl/MRDRNA2_/MRDRNA2_29103_c0_seq1:146-931(-)